MSDSKVTPRYVTGIDQSANHLAVVILNLSDRSVKFSALIEPTVKGVKRLHYLNKTLREYLSAHPQGALGIHEGYSFGSVHQPFLLGEVGGITKLALYDYNLQVEECAPTALKKYMAGYGGASKEDMKKAVEARWGVRYKDDNLADAFALAQLGWDLLHPEQVGDRACLEVVAHIRAKSQIKPVQTPSMPKARPAARFRRTPGVL